MSFVKREEREGEREPDFSKEKSILCMGKEGGGERERELIGRLREGEIPMTSTVEGGYDGDGQTVFMQ